MIARLRRNLPLVLTVVFVLVAAVVVVRGLGGGNRGVVVPASCSVRTPITVASSTEKSDLITDLAVQRYNREPGRCATVTVHGVKSGDAADAFGRGWMETQRFRPDVWSPAASMWIGVALTQRTAPGVTPAVGVVPASAPSVTQSRLVFALPASVAAQLGGPQTPLGWADLARLSSDPQARAARGLGPTFGLGKVNPEVSTPGLFAVLSAFQATPGMPDVLGTGAVTDPRAMAFEKSVENGVVHYGTSEQEFLRNMTAAAGRPGGAASYVGAVAVEEKSVWDYNRGNPDAVVPAPASAPPPEPLVAFSPREGTFVSDSPYLTLNWPGTTDATRIAAEDFRRWLADPERQAVFKQNGFRDQDGHTDGQLVPTNGFPASEPVVLAPPRADVVAAARDLWVTGLRKSANVTLIFDVSGSMNCAEDDPPPPPGRDCVTGDLGHTRLDRIRLRAADAFARLRPGDTLSVRTFSTTTSTTAPPVGPVDVGSPGSPTSPSDVVARAFPPGFRPYGGTALYRTSREAVDAARASADPNRINAVVVLTDGEESEETGPDAVATTAAVAADPARPARLFYIAYSRDAGRQEGSFANLGQIASSSGGFAYDARDPAKIDEAFNDVISNF